MDRTYGFYPTGTRNPFIRELISNDACTLVYDGYFYVDAADLPVQRIMVTYGEPVTNEKGEHCYTAASAAHIEIYEKISGEDTSLKYRDDERQQQVSEDKEQQEQQEQSQDQDQDKEQSQASEDKEQVSKHKEQIQDATGDSESTYSDDYDIIFFPTEITTLKYRVLKSNLTSQERNVLEAVIKEQTKAMEKERVNRMFEEAVAEEAVATEAEVTD